MGLAMELAILSRLTASDAERGTTKRIAARRLHHGQFPGSGTAAFYLQSFDS
jgi:hypothetical protein